MAYIDREQVCKNCNNKTYCEREKCPVYKVPTADVVPKSEVEALEKELVECYKKLDESVNFYCSFTKSKIQNCPIDDEVAKAKQEVAREIFEEIEKVANTDYQTPLGSYTVIRNDRYTELKKKYTESEDKG